MANVLTTATAPQAPATVEVLRAFYMAGVPQQVGTRLQVSRAVAVELIAAHKAALVVDDSTTPPAATAAPRRAPRKTATQPTILEQSNVPL